MQGRLGASVDHLNAPAFWIKGLRTSARWCVHSGGDRSERAAPFAPRLMRGVDY
jgi:uncharacterized protein (DUF2237 family)